jgi:hypothetical protein
MIVVDEAQDFKDWMWDMVDVLRSPEVHLLVIDGQGQLLYREDRAAYLTCLLQAARDHASEALIRLNRNLRNTNIAFHISQLFKDAFPSVDRANRSWEEQYRPAYEDATSHGGDYSSVALPGLDVFLSRPGARLPSLIPIGTPSTEEAAAEVSRLLKAGMSELQEKVAHDCTPGDVLILVPFATSKGRTGCECDWAQAARSACEELSFGFMDYSEPQNRRNFFSPDEIRICTYHSSRGVEGLYTLVLGFESLDAAARGIEWQIQDLAYIALSRSVYDSDVLYRVTPQIPTAVSFLKALLEIVNEPS